MSRNVTAKGGTMIAVKGNNHHCTILSNVFMWSRPEEKILDSKKAG